MSADELRKLLVLCRAAAGTLEALDARPVADALRRVAARVQESAGIVLPNPASVG